MTTSRFNSGRPLFEKNNMNARCSFGEPWVVNHDILGNVSVIDCLGRTVATLDGPGENWANADRIVECINKMNGVRDPTNVIIRFRSGDSVSYQDTKTRLEEQL